MSFDRPDPTAIGIAARTRDPDPQGHAALLLVESLLHGLISGSVLTVRQAVDIVDVAADVKVEVAEENGERPETLHRSLALLNSISASLRHDLGE